MRHMSIRSGGSHHGHRPFLCGVTALAVPATATAPSTSSTLTAPDSARRPWTRSPSDARVAGSLVGSGRIYFTVSRALPVLRCALSAMSVA